MPWESDRQRRWGNSPAGIAAMGQAKVNEFNQASKGMALPESAASRVAKRMVAAKQGAPKSQRKAMSRSKRVPFAKGGGKPRTVNLGQKGSFQIKHPGVFRAKAQAAGESTAAYAQQEKGAPGATGRQARAAIGLMAMH